MICLCTYTDKNDLMGFSHLPKTHLSLRSQKRVEGRALENLKEQIKKESQKTLTTRCQPETCVRVSKGLHLKARGAGVRKETVVGIVRKDSSVGWKRDCLQSMVCVFQKPKF